MTQAVELVGKDIRTVIVTVSYMFEELRRGWS